MKKKTEEINKIKCSVCGREFTPRKEHNYKASEYITEGGLGSAVSGRTERRQYDCFDCPMCGCQIVAKIRYKKDEE